MKKAAAKRGASLIIAMMVFLLCSLVGGAILAAASTNAGRIAGQRESGQNSLAVSSAARLLQAKLISGGANSLSAAKKGNSAAFTAPAAASDPVLRVVYEPAVRVFLFSSGAQSASFSGFAGFEGKKEPTGYSGFLASAGTLSVSPKSGLGDDFPDVSVDYAMDSSYTLTCTLTAGAGSSRQSLRLAMTAVVSESGGTTSILWGDPIISGEAAG
jgi:hypothetical protein